MLHSGCLAVASGGPVVFAYCIECVISLRLYFDVKLGGVVGLVGSLNRKVLKNFKRKKFGYNALSLIIFY